MLRFEIVLAVILCQVNLNSSTYSTILLDFYSLKSRVQDKLGYLVHYCPSNFYFHFRLLSYILHCLISSNWNFHNIFYNLI
jgi:hypothetical protein